LADRAKRKKRLDRSIKVRTEGLYAVTSWAEMAYLFMPRAVLVAGLLLLPLVLDPYWQRVICSAGIYALLAIGFDFLAEYVGLVCLGGAFFIGAGGYIAGLLNEYFHWSPFVTIPIATLLGAGISTLVLVPCLRLRGIYFAIVSFMFPLFAVFIIIASMSLAAQKGSPLSTPFPIPGSSCISSSRR